MSDVTIHQLEELAGTHSTRAASDVKANWRKIVDEARRFGEVIVTNYNRPEAVVVSVEQYVKMKALAVDPLKRLRETFDQELAVLRAPDAGEKLRKIFALTPEEIAEAANAAASRNDD